MQEWSTTLCREWMNENTEHAISLSIDDMYVYIMETKLTFLSTTSQGKNFVLEPPAINGPMQ